MLRQAIDDHLQQDRQLLLGGEKEEDDLTPMEKENIPLEDLKKTWMAKLNDDCLFISAKNKENIDEFREVLYKKVRELHVQKYPYNDFLYQDSE